MSFPSLYTVKAQYLSLMELGTDDDSPEAVAEFEGALREMKGHVQDRGEFIGAWILTREAWRKAAREAAEALEIRALNVAKRIETAKAYLRGEMEALSLKKIEGPEFTLARKLNPPRVEIGPDAEVPDELRKGDDPLVAQIVAAARKVEGNEDMDAPLVLTDEQLAAIVRGCLPPAAPDKKAIAQALKDWQAACVGTPIERRPENPAPGCWLEQGERLEVSVTMSRRSAA